MAVLTNKSIASTYKSVLSIGATTESALTTSIQQLTDGLGNGSPLSMSTTQIQFNNNANTFSFPADRGTSGQILKLADANGTLSWADDDLSNTLDFSGGTGTGSVTLDTQTLAFTGTANQIETSASSQAITLSFPTAGVTLPNGSVATTQTASDNSTKVATTAYVDNQLSTSGTVTSVALSVPTGLTVSGSPITTSGTITIGGTLGVANGGTGATTLTGILLGNGTSAVSASSNLLIASDGTITLSQPNNVPSDIKNYNIGGGNIALNTDGFNTGFGEGNLSQVGFVGSNNSAFGYQSSFSMTDGDNNTSVGFSSLLNETVGADNTAIGNYSLFYSNNGSFNTAIGSFSLYVNTSGGQNVALGYEALNFNTTSSQNTALGFRALRISTGDHNLGVGYNSGSAITTGSKNVIIGSFTGFRAAATGVTEYSIIASSNNIVLSDGDGNVRQSFDSTGAATFSGALSGTSATMGVAKISNWTTINTFARFGHSSYDSGTNYGYLQDSAGTVYIEGTTVNLSTTSGNTTNVGGLLSGGAATFSSSVTAGGKFEASFSNTNTAFDNSAYLRLVNTGTYTLNQRVDLIMRFEDGTYNGIGGISMVRESATARSSKLVLQPIASDGNNVEALTLASTGAATFQSASAKSLTGSFNVSINDSTSTFAQGVGGGITLGGYKSATALEFFAAIDGYKENGTSGNAAGAFRVLTQPSDGSGLVERLRISSGGVVSIPNGIVFNNNSVTGNKTSVTLNAYEEGTWTAIPQRITTAISGTIVTSCNYVKIGKLVYYNIDIDIQAITAQASNICTIGGLPFAVSTSQSRYSNQVIFDKSAQTAITGMVTDIVGTYVDYAYNSITVSQSGGSWQVGRIALSGMYIST